MVYKLTIEEIQRIIQLVQERAEVKARATLSWELGKDVEVRLVNSALVRIDIDGYKVTNPVGFQGRDLEVQMYTAFAPMIHIGALERVATELDLELFAGFFHRSMYLFGIILARCKGFLHEYMATGV